MAHISLFPFYECNVLDSEMALPLGKKWVIWSGVLYPFVCLSVVYHCSRVVQEGQGKRQLTQAPVLFVCLFHFFLL